MGLMAAIKFTESSMPVYYKYDSDVEIGEYYYVESPSGDGEEIGRVAALEARCNCQMDNTEVPRVIRLAEIGEVCNWQRRKERESEYLKICRAKVKEHKLEMKVSFCKIDEKNNKVIFNFTADQRVDFRELVKDLASSLRSRIELWQIGVRDEAKMIDGIDVCGQQICCSSWMKKFDPVSIKHARDQDIMRAPSKLAGLCGRLRCCLTFEHEAYLDMKKGAPEIGLNVFYEGKEGVIIDRSLIRREALVRDKQEGKFERHPFDALEKTKSKAKAASTPAPTIEKSKPAAPVTSDGATAKKATEQKPAEQKSNEKTTDSKPRRENRNNRPNRSRDRNQNRRPNNSPPKASSQNVDGKAKPAENQSAKPDSPNKEDGEKKTNRNRRRRRYRPRNDK